MTKPTADERRYMALAAELPCQACGAASEQLHHPRSLALGCGMGLKAPHTAVIPLCFRCHEEFHRLGRRTWEAKWGRSQLEMSQSTQALIDGKLKQRTEEAPLSP